MAEINVSAQATVQPLSKDAITVPNIKQPKPPEHTSLPSDGLFVEAYQDASLLHEHLHIANDYAARDMRAATAFAKIHLLPVEKSPCYFVCTKQPKPTLRAYTEQPSLNNLQKLLSHNNIFFSFRGDCIKGMPPSYPIQEHWFAHSNVRTCTMGFLKSSKRQPVCKSAVHHQQQEHVHHATCCLANCFHPHPPLTPPQTCANMVAAARLCT